MADTSDPFDLGRFVAAQADVYAQALSEIKRGRKCSHWIWFIFPQIDGLGTSTTSRFYGIKSADEARAYLSHSVLGPRLTECSEVLLRSAAGSAEEIFGYPDYLKLRSSMTLFASVSGAGSVFEQVLAKYFDGEPDEKTLELLK